MTPGTKIILGGTEYIMPPIPLEGLAEIGDRLNQLGGAITPISAATLIDSIFLSLKRNYPEIKREEVSANIDFINFQATLDAFVSVNKLEPKANALGEIKG